MLKNTFTKVEKKNGFANKIAKKYSINTKIGNY